MSDSLVCQFCVDGGRPTHELPTGEFGNVCAHHLREMLDGCNKHVARRLAELEPIVKSARRARRELNRRGMLIVPRAGGAE